MEYLGHIISGEGVCIDPKKDCNNDGLDIPYFCESFIEFLGLIGYYKKFIQNYGKIVAPLTTLLKKNSFGWPTHAEMAV